MHALHSLDRTRQAFSSCSAAGGPAQRHAFLLTSVPRLVCGHSRTTRVLSYASPEDRQSVDSEAPGRVADKAEAAPTQHSGPDATSDSQAPHEGPDARGEHVAAHNCATDGDSSSHSTSSSSSNGPNKSLPQLPIRSSRNSSNGTTSSSRQRPGSPQKLQLPPPTPRAFLQERALAGLLAYTGMMGTLATAISYFFPEMDLFGNFHLAPADILLGLKLMLPIYLMNVVIMWPNYSSWQLPDPTVEDQQEIADALTMRLTAKDAASNSSSSNSSSDQGSTSRVADEATASEQPSSLLADRAAVNELIDADTPATASSTNSSRDDLSNSSSSYAADSRDDIPAHLVAGRAADIAAILASTSRQQRDNSTSISRSSDGSRQPGFWLQSPAAVCMKDALFLAQGHYLSSNPALVLPPALQAVVLVVECLAAELLYRSVTLQLAGGWLTDRLFEAGADDFVHIAGTAVPLHTAAELGAVALLSGAWVVAVARRVAIMGKRTRVIQIQDGQMSENMLSDLTNNASKARIEQQSQQQQSMSNGSNCDSSSISVSEPVSSDRQQHDAPSDDRAASRAAADLAAAAAAGGLGNAQPDGSSSRQPRQRQQQQPGNHWVNTLSALALSQVVQGLHDAGQMMALSLTYVLTGNLAASFVAAVVNQVLMTALQQRGVERARKRSLAFARHLAGLTRQLRDMRRKQEAKQLQQQQQVEQEAQLRQLTATNTKGLDVAAASHSGGDVADAQDADTSVAGMMHGAADAADPASKGFNGKMEQTISVLDQILGQLGEPAPGHGAGK